MRARTKVTPELRLRARTGKLVFPGRFLAASLRNATVPNPQHFSGGPTLIRLCNRLFSASLVGAHTTSTLSTYLETSICSHPLTMASYNLRNSYQTRFPAPLGITDTAESDKMEADAKRQKISSVGVEGNMSSGRPDTVDLTIFDDEHPATNKEVTVIKQEDWKLAEEVFRFLDQTQDIVESQGSNESETVSNETATISTMEALGLAERCVDEYAGPDTSTLETRRKQFKGLSLAYQQHSPAVSTQANIFPAGKINSNKNCLRCLGTNANVKCRSCPRVYHRACLPDEQLESIRAMLEKEEGPDLGEEHEVSIYCPLCYKRFFSCLRQKSDLTPANREQRIMVIAHQLKRLPERVAWMQLHDDGSLVSDRKLLEDLGQKFRTQSARYRP